jgi:hypothetical protein
MFDAVGGKQKPLCFARGDNEYLPPFLANLKALSYFVGLA